jgi:DEAD/DEAH box helicase domain-containing protein
LLDQSSTFLPGKLNLLSGSSYSSEPERTTSPQFPIYSIRDLIEELKNSGDYQDQIVPDGHLTMPEQPAIFGSEPVCFRLILGDLSRGLSPALRSALLKARNISKLYCHQALAINHLWENNHVIVSTSTASGKSLIYQIPVLDALEQDPDVKALYIFPTKALAQDQKKSLSSILANLPQLSHVLVETFDGDTPQHERNRIRDTASGMDITLPVYTSDFYEP